MSCQVSLCSMLCNVWWSVQLFCFAHFQSPFCYPSEVRLLPAWCRDHLIWTVDLTSTVKRGDCLWCVNCLNRMEIQRKFGENKSHGSASARLKVRHSCELMNFHSTDVKWRGRTRVWASIPLLIRFFLDAKLNLWKSFLWRKIRWMENFPKFFLPLLAPFVGDGRRTPKIE